MVTAIVRPARNSQFWSRGPASGITLISKCRIQTDNISAQIHLQFRTPTPNSPEVTPFLSFPRKMPPKKAPEPLTLTCKSAPAQENGAKSRFRLGGWGSEIGGYDSIIGVTRMGCKKWVHYAHNLSTLASSLRQVN